MRKDEVLSLTEEALFARLQTRREGLSDREAASRLAERGPNVLGTKHLRAFRVLVDQFRSSLVFLLIAASALAFAIGDVQDGSIILVLFSINTVLGFYQEYRSERTMEKLSALITRQVRVKRDDTFVLIDDSRLVPGDVVSLHEGDIVPADIRLYETTGLSANESQLSGESLPVGKTAAPDHTDEHMIVYAGSVIEKGEGQGVVYATGKETALGSIATLSSETRKRTKYEEFLQSFSNDLMRVIGIVLVLVFASKLALTGAAHVTELLLFIIALAVSTVPEMLPVIATVTLSHGAQRLSKKHVVVKRLSAMEDLGNVNLLCTDKTGTITENKMTVHALVSDDTELLETLAFACIAPTVHRKRRTSNSYDSALEQYVSAAVQKKAGEWTIAKELPFDPEERRRRVVLSRRDGPSFLVVIGAPDVLLSVAHTPHHAAYRKAIAAEGESGLHHLALAYKEVAFSPDMDLAASEGDLAFLGYISFLDPLRTSAKSTIARAEKLGIGIKILTGDSREVATYVGREVGLLGADDHVQIGSELDALSPEDFKDAVTRGSVFARVSPAQKYAIIKALKEDYTVAYQGDGINDAPALKLADVAIAVAGATDIAKESADVILLNQSLDVIIGGIRSGRAIFVNINKYIRYTMSNNFGLLIGLSTLYLFSPSVPLLPVQALLNNLLGDIPLTTVASDTVDDEEVVAPETHRVHELMRLSLLLGIPTAAFEVLYAILSRFEPLPLFRTELFVFLTFQALVVFFSVRTKRHLWRAKRPSLLLTVSFAVAFVSSLALVFIPDFQIWFSFTPIPSASVAGIVVLMLVYLLITDQLKVWYFGSA